jgi:hypothetical protein
MKHATRFLLALFWVGASLIPLQGQWTLAAAGGDSSGGGGSVNFTAGQIAYLAVETPQGAVLQGVQQPFFIVSVKEVKRLEINCLLYPNPVENELTLKIEDFAAQDLRYQLFDLNGRLFAAGPVTTAETTIPTSALQAGNYLLTLRDAEGGLISFKIVKTR